MNDVMGTSLEDDAIESANQYLKEKGCCGYWETIIKKGTKKCLFL